MQNLQCTGLARIEATIMDQTDYYAVATSELHVYMKCFCMLQTDRRTYEQTDIWKKRLPGILTVNKITSSKENYYFD